MGGIFREQGVDVVKSWLDPLFEPLVDNAYQSQRRDHLLPEPSAPATPSPTPSPSPPPQWAAAAPNLPRSTAGCLTEANVPGRRGSDTQNRDMQNLSLAAGASSRVIGRYSGRRPQQGMGSRDGVRGDAGKYAGTWT